jgi:hypothetical protein
MGVQDLTKEEILKHQLRSMLIVYSFNKSLEKKIKLIQLFKKYLKVRQINIELQDFIDIAA